ncbi:hypothetical protein [Lacibacter sediminis]|uniref:VOC family protein n=1 Tax=Lacibacter sediminis TaxID=2760713 RepID=A0A7G5XIP4_9BACT|nr:hypothetical protein [Lacibacter sediminis]QNA45347.1 hypothetical protein H4075_03875 [Lacibacter sediminis]
MKRLLSTCMTSLFLLIFTAAQSQVNKIEHFFASSPKAETLFQFFSQQLELPVVWKYQTWGDFASGGVTLGNVAFELVTFKGADTTSFNGIALEPTYHMEEFQKDLDKVGIAHDTIDNSNVSTDSSGTLRGWSLFTPKDVLPNEANLFVCDYKERQRIIDNRKKASDKLLATNGGGLGVVSLKEIVVSTTDFKKYDEQFAKLPGVKKVKNGLFSFSDGPDLRLQADGKNYIPKIVIKVHSLKKAKAFLESKKVLGKVNANSIFILPEAMDGLQIELVEK